MDLRDELTELPWRGGRGGPRPAMRAFGIVAMAVVLVSIVAVDPEPGLSGEHAWVSLALALYVTGLALSLPRRTLPPGVRAAGLLMVGAGSCITLVVQPDGAGYAGVYYVVVLAGLRLKPRAGLAIAGATLAAEIALTLLTADDAAGKAVGLFFSVVPWALVIQLLRGLAAEREELRESRAAHAAAAAEGERSRVARDLHDVLAHSLSALALSSRAPACWRATGGPIPRWWRRWSAR